MRELCIEGLATHDGPEPCGVICEGGGEALAGVGAGKAIEPRNNLVRGADAVPRSGRQHLRQRYRELAEGPARSVNLCMRRISMGENREVSWPPAALITERDAQGRLRPDA